MRLTPEQQKQVDDLTTALNTRGQSKGAIKLAIKNLTDNFLPSHDGERNDTPEPQEDFGIGHDPLNLEP
jgi:hypothetical protein